METPISTRTLVNGDSVIHIGDDFHNFFVNGHMDEIRVSKGIARWTTNFVPPALPYGNSGLIFKDVNGAERSIVLN